jgi:hypothetical protein
MARAGLSCHDTQLVIHSAAAAARRHQQSSHTQQCENKHLRVQGSSFREVRLVVNRAVAKAHERLARDLQKQAGDDRELRMQALKANDFAAYQDLLRATAGGEAVQDERCAPLLCGVRPPLRRLLTT